MGTRLAALSRQDRDAVLSAVAAVEIADQPVSAASLRALLDPALREHVRECLRQAGRVLKEPTPGAYQSGYDDTIADRLVADGLGVLQQVDRAVLALVLLRSVAIPRARGRIGGTDWTEAVATSIDELAMNRSLTKERIRNSVRRLRTAGILRPGLRPEIRPGPQFRRLTQARSTRIWEELMLLCQPNGLMAEIIRRRRRNVVAGGIP